MKPVGVKAFSLAFSLGMAAGHSAIPDSVHPDFNLSKVPLPANYKVMGLSFLGDGRMVLATTVFMGGGQVPESRSSDHKVFLVSGVTKTNPADIKMVEIANNWFQIAGVVVAKGKLYVSDRDGFYEINQLSAPANLGQNRRLIVEWPNENTWVNGFQWHQYAFTPMYKDGFFYAPYSGSINPGGRSDVNQSSKLSGAFLKWDLAGNLEGYAGGLRSPNGANLDAATGEMYVADNEGSWLPSSTFALMKPGKFYGHSNVSTKGHVANWAETLPYEPPVAWLPHKELRASPSQPIVITQGIFAGDWLLGDINDPGLVRIALDRVGPTPNGAVFRFSQGFLNAALNRMAHGPDGSIFIGTFNKIGGNWPTNNNSDMQPLYRLAAKPGAPTAFEMKAVRSVKDGIEIEFTLPVKPSTATPESFTLFQQEFKRMETYGAGEQTKQLLAVSETDVSADGKRVFLKVSGLLANRVLHIKHTSALQSASGKTAWNDAATYTHNHLSTRAWNATVGIRPVARAERLLESAVTHRVVGTGLVSVEVRSQDPWRAALVSPDGSTVAAASGSGESSLRLSRGNSRAGLHFLRVRIGEGEVVRKIVF